VQSSAGYGKKLVDSFWILAVSTGYVQSSFPADSCGDELVEAAGIEPAASKSL